MTTVSAVVEAVVDVAVTVVVTATATAAVTPARRLRAVPLASSSPSSVVALDVDVVLLLLRKQLRTFWSKARYGFIFMSGFTALQNGIGNGEMTG